MIAELNHFTEKTDYEITSKIVDRYMEFHYSLGVPKHLQREKWQVMLDLEVTHCNGCPIDFERLLNAPDSDFSHDMIGIQTHLNRNTGELENCFLPRYAKN